MNNRKNISRKQKKGFIKKLQDKRKNYRRKTEYRKLKRENEAFSKKQDHELEEFQDDAADLLRSIQETDGVWKDGEPVQEEILGIPEIETALAFGKNKKLNDQHRKSRNKSMSGAKIIGKIKYKGGRKRRKKKTRRKTRRRRKRRRKSKRRRKR
tara:strand:+ start:442 stop:903 length:462 start_codon:yes stop_codon:yes gene_type:complete